MEENKTVTRDPKFFHFNFDWPEDFEEIEFEI